MSDARPAPRELVPALATRAAATGFALVVREEGAVLSAGDGIAFVAGLPGAQLYELVAFETGERGIVFDLAPARVGVVLLTGRDGVRAGERVWRTGATAAVPAGTSLLGRFIDPLGRPLDGEPAPAGTTPAAIEREAPPLLDRELIDTPLPTGIRAVDALLPIGRGQRELVIGDPATGKTALAVDALANQRTTGVIAVYAAIGLKKAQILRVVGELRAHGDFARTVVVATDAADPLGLQYLAPFAATAVAERFLAQGRDVLIVYDDLTKHAEAYRSLSLLLKRPPGREAFPGDIFHLHARLLERAAKLRDGAGGGSITALPIVETQQGRISSYVPTNLISITDGQLYLDAALAARGQRPALDVGRSVSRIGGRAQTGAMRSVAERLKIDYLRFLEVEVFSRFGAHVEEETARVLRRGRHLRELLRQPRFEPAAPAEIVASFLVLESGGLDALEPAAVAAACRERVERLRAGMPALWARIEAGERPTADERERALTLVREPA